MRAVKIWHGVKMGDLGDLTLLDAIHAEFPGQNLHLSAAYLCIVGTVDEWVYPRLEAFCASVGATVQTIQCWAI